MDSNHDTVAKAIGVAPQIPEGGACGSNPVTSSTPEQQNVIQGRASCGEQATNAFRPTKGS